MTDQSSRNKHLFSLVRLRSDCAVMPTQVDFAPTFPNTPIGLAAPSAAPTFNQDRCCFTPAFILPQQVLPFLCRKHNLAGSLKNNSFNLDCGLLLKSRTVARRLRKWLPALPTARSARSISRAITSTWVRRATCSDGNTTNSIWTLGLSAPRARRTVAHSLSARSSPRQDIANAPLNSPPLQL